MKPSSGVERKRSLDSNNEREGSRSSKLIPQGSRTLKQAIQRYTPVQVWDWFFKSCEVNGKMLLQEGLVGAKDIQECMVKGNCKKLGIQLPAWSILQCLLTSTKSDSSGLILSEEMELTRLNLPRDKVFEWFIGPLFTMKEQIKGLHLQENEENCLKKLVLACNNDRPEDWDNTGFPSTDKVRRAQLQAVIRRLQGIVGSMSRLPTFRRRFRNLVKVLYVEAIQTGDLAKHMTGSSRIRSFGLGGRRNRNGAEDEQHQSKYNSGDMV